MDMEAMPDETGSCEHIYRSRRATALLKQLAPHNLGQSSCAVAAHMVDTAAVVEAEEDTRTVDQLCSRS